MAAGRIGRHFVEFLDASFASPGTTVLFKRPKSAPTDQDRQEAEEVHKSALTALTRLRVLASKRLVRSAEQLHLADDYSYAVFLGDVALPDKETWNLHQEERRNRLLTMLTAARHELHLEEAVAPDPALFSPVTLPAHLQVKSNDQRR